MYVEEMGFEDVNRARSSGILLWAWEWIVRFCERWAVRLL